MAPVYGTTIFVWTAIISLTMGGLAIGYFIGGRLAERRKKRFYLFSIFLASALFVSLMPFLLNVSTQFIAGSSFRIQPVLSALFFLLPPILLLGCVGPILIETATQNIMLTGKIAGQVFASSTIGGISAIVVLAYWAMPMFGLRESLISTSFILIITAFAIYFLPRFSRTLPQNENQV